MRSILKSLLVFFNRHIIGVYGTPNKNGKVNLKKSVHFSLSIMHMLTNIFTAQVN